MRFFARGLATSIAGNISLVILSVALALSLWLFVTDAENPTGRETFNSAVTIGFVNVPNGLAVANSSANTVRIDIEGPENDLRTLRPADFEAQANLGGFEQGKQTVAVSVVSRKSDVRVVRITPEQVEVTLEGVRTREVPVRIELVGALKEGFAAGDRSANPDTATISGPQSLVDLVDEAVAEVGVTGRSADFTEDRVPLSPRDARGGEISRVTVSPVSASIDVNVEQSEFSQQFTVSPRISGNPAAGYNVTGIAIDPPLVTVRASLAVLQSIDPVAGIPTSEISISDARSTIVQEAELRLPPDSSVLGSIQVTVTVTIAPVRGEVSFLVVPQIRNVGDGLAVTPAGSIVVTLSGDLPTLQAITAESIIVVGDAQGLGPGLHVLPIQVTPPAGTAVVRVEPGELGVALAARP
jgi:YbbR domain-containing protein